MLAKNNLFTIRMHSESYTHSDIDLYVNQNIYLC